MTLAPAAGNRRNPVRDPAPDYNTSDYRHTDNPASTAAVRRTIDIYVVEDEFDTAERERVGLALQQWNHVLNGYVRFRILSLPGAPSEATLTQLYRSGAWIVTKIDRYHFLAREPGALAAAVWRKTATAASSTWSMTASAGASSQP